MKRMFLLLFIVAMILFSGCNQAKTPDSAATDGTAAETEHPVEEAPAENTPAENETPNDASTLLERLGLDKANGTVCVLVEPSLDFASVDSFHEGLARVCSGDKYGFVDQTGSVVVPIIYDYAEPFSGGLAKVYLGNYNESFVWMFNSGPYQCGYVDMAGNVAVPVEYDGVGDFNEGLAWVAKNGKSGFVDRAGNIVVPMIYDTAFSEDEWEVAALPHFSEGLAAVEIAGKCGFVDKAGVLVIPPEYDGGFCLGEWGGYFPLFEEGLAWVAKDGRLGVIDQTGAVVVPFEYDQAGWYYGRFSDGLCLVRKDGKAGYIDRAGNVVVPLQYGYSCDFDGGLAYVKQDSDSANFDGGTYIDTAGREIGPFEFEGDAWSDWLRFPPAEGLIIASKGEKLGCIDAEGKTVIPFEFRELRYCADGLWYAETADYTSVLIDRMGARIPLPEGCEIEYNGYAEGRILIRKNYSEYGFADMDGSIIVPPMFTSAKPYCEGFAAVSTGPWSSRQYGLFDVDGNVALPVIYDEVMQFSEGLAWVKKGGMWGILQID